VTNDGAFTAPTDNAETSPVDGGGDCTAFSSVQSMFVRSVRAGLNSRQC